MNAVEIREMSKKVIESGGLLETAEGLKLVVTLLTEIAAAQVSIANSLSHNLNVITFPPDPFV